MNTSLCSGRSCCCRGLPLRAGLGVRASGHFLPPPGAGLTVTWVGGGPCWLEGSDPYSPCPASFAMHCLPEEAHWRVAGPCGVGCGAWGVGCAAAACSELAGLQSWFCFSSALSQGRFCGLGSLTDKARPSPSGTWLGFSARSRASELRCRLQGRQAWPVMAPLLQCPLPTRSRPPLAALRPVSQLSSRFSTWDRASGLRSLGSPPTEGRGCPEPAGTWCLPPSRLRRAEQPV